jgi:GGDEF domain-containing protein
LAGTVEAVGVAVRLHVGEFAVPLPCLLLGSRGRDAAGRVATRLGAAVATPVWLDGVSVQVTTSVGVAVSPRARADLSVLLRVVDQRMYATKHSPTPLALGEGEQAAPVVEGRWSWSRPSTDPVPTRWWT